MTHAHWTPPSKVNQERGFKIHLLIFLLTIPMIWLVWYLTDRSYLWPVWPTGMWTIGIVFHFLGLFVFKRSKNV